MQVSELPDTVSFTARWAARLRSSSMMRQSALVFASTMFMNVCGFVFHAIASRKLGVAEYGALYSLMSLMLIAAVPFGIFGSVVVKFAAEFRALHDASHLRGLALGLGRAFGIVGLVYVVVSVAGAIPIADFLHVPVWTISAVGVLVAVSLLTGVSRSFAQGMQDFNAFAVSTSVDGVARVAGVAAFAAIGWGVFGGLLGVFVGVALGFAYIGALLFVRYRETPPADVQYDWRRIAIATGGSAAATVVVTLMGYADVILVKHFFDAHDAGIYSAASLGGKILLFLVGFVPTVLLPQAADRHARGESTRIPLAISCVMLGAFALVGLLVFHFFGLLILHALVGHAFDAATLLLTWYGLAMVFLAVTSLLAAYGIATHRMAFAIPIVVCTVATLGAIALHHPTLLSVVHVLLIGNVVTALAAAVSLAWQGVSGERARTT